MTNKTRKQKQLATVKTRKQQKQNSKPFSEAGAIAGGKIGSMFNLPWARGVGKWLGSGIGQIFGSGDYSLSGAPPDYNVLVNSAQIPQFSKTNATNIVCHREYLGDISGTAAFNNRVYPINPGMAATFPWLNTVANNYQEYRFHGLIFEFRPMITDFITGGAPGTVIMATNYNADAPSYTSKQNMENSEYAVSVKPTLPMIHGVECAGGQTILPQRYVRNGAVPTGQDLRLYDAGNFQFATTANPVQQLGELWVSYCVEFFKPIMPDAADVNIASLHIARNTSVSGTNPFGLVQLSVYTNMSNVSSTANSVTFDGIPGAYYMFTYYDVAAGSSVNFQDGVWVLTGLSALTKYNNYSDSILRAPGATQSTFQCSVGRQFLCTLSSIGACTIQFTTGWTVPAGNSVDLIVTQVSSVIE